MEQSSSPDDVSGGSRPPQAQPTHKKRSRILLSCAPCRASKLKCDREEPCGQCLKKERAHECTYVPKPQKRKPSKGMSARLRRLEGMVRGMMQNEDSEGPVKEEEPQEPNVAGPLQNQVVHGKSSTTFLGATHCMAMLEDIEDLKSYFDDDREEDRAVGSPEANELAADELLLYSRGAPRNREELLERLPERRVCDRLVTRYYESMSPSQHVTHRPTFTRAYARFWQDPSATSLHWVAQLYMMLSLGVLFNSHSAPHELQADCDTPAWDRMTQYRTCAGWALIWGRYSRPTMTTLPAFMLYLDSYFILSRATQMTSYLLSGICLRLMLKMGLHREPSKLANISPFEGEMRRRMWNLGSQLEVLISFHMGLPSMVQGIETDAQPPRNFADEDFDEDSTELPPERPDTDYTSMSYPIFKTRMLKVFGEVAKAAHALSPPTYSQTMKLDDLVEETWKGFPAFIKSKPLDDCVGDPPILIVQRFSLEGLYCKCRCVLHRRYLAEPVPKREHDYPRRQCFTAAVSLMKFQDSVFGASQEGHLLSTQRWFLSSIAVHDHLLAAVIIYIVIKSEHYPEDGGECEWLGAGFTVPAKDELKEMMKRSHYIWLNAAYQSPEVQKTADTMAVILAKVGCPVESAACGPVNGAANGAENRAANGAVNGAANGLVHETLMENVFHGNGAPSGPWYDDATALSVEPLGNGSGPLSTISTIGSTPNSGATPFSFDQPVMATPGTSFAFDPMLGNNPNMLDLDSSWMAAGDQSMDWRYIDISLANSHTGGGPDMETGPAFFERMPMNDLDIMTAGVWDQSLGGNGFNP